MEGVIHRYRLGVTASEEHGGRWEKDLAMAEDATAVFASRGSERNNKRP